MLSIIIPTLNEERYLPTLLGSIKKQEFDGDYEIIVADAGSEDKTREIAGEFGCQVVDGGLPAKGRNQGAAAARGELLLFLDAETVPHPGLFKKALIEFGKRELDIASCGLEPETKHKIPKILYDLFYNWPAAALENVFPYASNFILVKREIHQKIGGFDEGITLAEDHAYAREAAKVGKFGFLKSVKQRFVLRRYLKEGELKICFKYLLCNLYNVFIGNVRSDIFNYRFGQYKELEEKAQGGVLSGFKFLLQPQWLIAFLLTTLLAVFSWLIIFLFFSPKLIILKLKALF